eukprot:2568463-Rhodomonas_salina.2
MSSGSGVRKGLRSGWSAELPMEGLLPGHWPPNAERLQEQVADAGTSEDWQLALAALLVETRGEDWLCRLAGVVQ